jgi:hypothetical protein
MSVFSRRSNVVRNGGRADAFENLSQRIIDEIPDLLGFWDSDPLRVTMDGSNVDSVANRAPYSGAGSLIPVEIAESLPAQPLVIPPTVSLTGLPPGGQVRQWISFSGANSLGLPQGLVPFVTTSAFTVVWIGKPDIRYAKPGGENAFLFRGQNTSIEIFRLLLDGVKMHAQIRLPGSETGGQNLTTLFERIPASCALYAIASFDQVTKVLTINANGRPLQVVTGASQHKQTNEFYYIGGHSTAGLYTGMWSSTLLFGGTAPTGDLFAAGREADLQLVTDYCEFAIGQRNFGTDA